MSDYLLDTHVFLWWILDEPRLSLAVRDLLKESAEPIYVSSITGLEIATKAKLGKLSIPDQPGEFLRKQLVANHFLELPLSLEAAANTYSLPFHHRDPFDRTLISQAKLHNAILVTNDACISEYDLETYW